MAWAPGQTIPDLPVDATLADVIAKINDILALLRAVTALDVLVR